MKYIVITSKHHDGFAMYDSDVSSYDIVESTPFKQGSDARRSPTRRNGRACSFAFYYSIMDWHHPSQYVNAPGKDPTAGDGKTEDARRDRSRSTSTYMKAQLEELITQVRPGRALVRRRVGRLVDRGGRPGRSTRTSAA